MKPTLTVLATILSGAFAISIRSQIRSTVDENLARDDAESLGIFVAYEDTRFSGPLYKYVPMANLTEEEKQQFFTEVKEDEEAGVDVAPDNIVMKPKDSLFRFITKLRRFLEQTCFSVSSFESASPKLEQELSNYTSLIEKLDPPQPKQLQRLKFAKLMFETMVDAIEPLKHYEFMGREDLHLVNRMIVSRLKLYAMYDTEGAPDTNRKDYDKTLRKFTISKDFWKSQFNDLTGVLIGVRSMFKKQLRKVNGLLRELEGRASKPHQSVS